MGGSGSRSRFRRGKKGQGSGSSEGGAGGEVLPLHRREDRDQVVEPEGGRLSGETVVGV